MRSWIQQVTGVSEKAFSALAYMAVLFICGVGAMLSVQYVVNSVRDTSHWVEYIEVEPVISVYPLGFQPVFYSKAIWKLPVVASWSEDIMWCTPEAGPYKGKRRRLDPNGNHKSYRSLKKPGKVGFYADDGQPELGSLPGYWTWNGDIPRYPATCTLEARPIIYPSPGVARLVPVPESRPFRFE